MEELLKVREVAKLLRISESNLRNVIRRGELPVVRIGKKLIRIRESAVMEFIEGGPMTNEGDQDVE